MKGFSLVRYVARYWTKHAQVKDTSPQTEDMMSRLFDSRNSNIFLNMDLDVLYNMNHNEIPCMTLATPLYYAALPCVASMV